MCPSDTWNAFFFFLLSVLRFSTVTLCKKIKNLLIIIIISSNQFMHILLKTH